MTDKQFAILRRDLLLLMVNITTTNAILVDMLNPAAPKEEAVKNSKRILRKISETTQKATDEVEEQLKEAGVIDDDVNSV